MKAVIAASSKSSGKQRPVEAVTGFEIKLQQSQRPAESDSCRVDNCSGMRAVSGCEACCIASVHTLLT